MSRNNVLNLLEIVRDRYYKQSNNSKLMKDYYSLYNWYKRLDSGKDINQWPEGTIEGENIIKLKRLTRTAA